MSNENHNALSKNDPQLLKLVSGGTFAFKAFEEDILALSSIVAGTSYQNLTDIEEKIQTRTETRAQKRVRRICCCGIL